MFPKRRIIESDEDKEEEENKIKIKQNKIKNQRKEEKEKEKKKKIKDNIISSDEEWDSKECYKFIHEKCDDEVGAIPIKIVGEQLGDEGIEYDVIFQEIKSKGRIIQYNDWIPERSLTKRMLILKSEYENVNNVQNINSNLNSINYASESDDNEVVINVKNEKNKDIPKTNEDYPCAPRRSSRSSGTRRSMTRQKLNDLMDLRNRSKSGLGVLRFDDVDDNGENNHNNNDDNNEEDDDENNNEIEGDDFTQPQNTLDDSDFETRKSKPKLKVNNNTNNNNDNKKNIHSTLKYDETTKFDHYNKDKAKKVNPFTLPSSSSVSRKPKRNIQEIYHEDYDNEESDENINENGRGYESDDIENFIVGDDLGEEELYEEEVLEERRRRKARRKQKLISKKKKDNRKHKREYDSEDDDDDDDDDEEEFEGEDNDNGADEEEDNHYHHKNEKKSKVSNHNVKKKGRRIVKEESDEDDNQSEEHEANFSDENEEDDEDEDEDYGVADYSLYRRLENMNEELEETTPIVFRQPMSLPEAMTHYIDMMSKILTLGQSSSSSLSSTTTTTTSTVPKTPSKSNSSAYYRPNIQMTSDLKAAIRKIEGLICTSRESLLGSSAWKGEFYEQLKSRPFYTVVESHRDGDGVCDACSRVSGGAVYSVYLYGPSYDSSRIWDNQNWIEFLPKEILPTYSDLLGSPGISSSVARVSLRDRTPEKDNKDNNGNNDSDDDYKFKNMNGMKGKEWWKKSWPIELTREKESRWSVTSHCMRRTQLYHTLLHYKLRLLLKVKTKLERNGYSAKAVIQDTDFISCETERFQRLITSAGQKYGGEEQSKFTLWSDDEKDETTVAAEKSMKKSSSSSSNPSQYYPPLKITSRSPHKPKLSGNNGTLDQWIFKKKK